MRRLNWLLALVLVLGPASLRWVHGATAHQAEAAALASHDADHHHHEDGPDSKPAHDHHCGVCDELASLSPDLPVPPAVPAFVPDREQPIRCVPAKTPVTVAGPRICRGQPPPQA